MARARWPVLFCEFFCFFLIHSFSLSLFLFAGLVFSSVYLIPSPPRYTFQCVHVHSSTLWNFNYFFFSSMAFPEKGHRQFVGIPPLSIYLSPVCIPVAYCGIYSKCSTCECFFRSFFSVVSSRTSSVLLQHKIQSSSIFHVWTILLFFRPYSTVFRRCKAKV